MIHGRDGLVYYLHLPLGNMIPSPAGSMYSSVFLYYFIKNIFLAFDSLQSLFDNIHVIKYQVVFYFVCFICE